LIAAQGLVGIVQWQLQLPPGIVWVHVVLATLTWIMLLFGAATGGRIGAPVPPSEPVEPVPAARELARS
jgi:hypothetical protein